MCNMKSDLKWQRMAAAFFAIDRLVLAAYMIALLGLLLFPLVGPGFSFLGIESDKWMHIVLFAGLAILLRWNLSARRHPLFASFAVGFAVAAATEVAQGLVAYRSAEFLDLVAGMFGTVLGATIGDRILLSPFVRRLLGLLVVMLGLMVSALFLMADVIGIGDNKQFGLTQLGGMVLGATITFGGVKVYLTGLRGGSRRT